MLQVDGAKRACIPPGIVECETMPPLFDLYCRHQWYRHEHHHHIDDSSNFDITWITPTRAQITNKSVLKNQAVLGQSVAERLTWSLVSMLNWYELFLYLYIVLQALIYKMTAYPRGHAVILNNMNFTDSSLYKTREGSDIDVGRLTCLFRQLGFCVSIWQDVPSDVSTNWKLRESRLLLGLYSMVTWTCGWLTGY